MPTITVSAVDYLEMEIPIRAIRDAVFVREQRVPPALEHDELDAVAVHVLVWLDGSPVGTGRILEDGKIGRMAVLAAHRNFGIGRLVLEELMHAARILGLEGVYCSAQVSAIPFYEQAGFAAEGPVYVEAGIDHRRMHRQL